MKGFAKIKEGLKEIGKEAKDFVSEKKKDLIAMGLGLTGCYVGGQLVRKGFENTDRKTSLIGTALIAGSATAYGMACVKMEE